MGKKDYKSYSDINNYPNKIETKSLINNTCSSYSRSPIGGSSYGHSRSPGRSRSPAGFKYNRKYGSNTGYYIDETTGKKLIMKKSPKNGSYTSSNSGSNCSSNNGSNISYSYDDEPPLMRNILSKIENREIGLDDLDDHILKFVKKNYKLENGKLVKRRRYIIEKSELLDDEDDV